MGKFRTCLWYIPPKGVPKVCKGKLEEIYYYGGGETLGAGKPLGSREADPRLLPKAHRTQPTSQ